MAQAQALGASFFAGKYSVGRLSFAGERVSSPAGHGTGPPFSPGVPRADVIWTRHQEQRKDESKSQGESQPAATTPVQPVAWGGPVDAELRLRPP